MKSHKKLTTNELHLFTIKSAIQLNKSILDDVFHHIFTQVSDHDKLDCIYNYLETFIDNLDTVISRNKNDENNC